MKVNEKWFVKSATKKKTKKIFDRILNTSILSVRDQQKIIKILPIFFWNSYFVFIVVTFQESYNTLCCLYVLTLSWLWHDQTSKAFNYYCKFLHLRCLRRSWLLFWRYSLQGILSAISFDSQNKKHYTKTFRKTVTKIRF